MSKEEFHLIVIGSESAGAIVASRFAKGRSVSVLLAEAGGQDRSPLPRIPAAARYAMNAPLFNWGFATEPEPHLDGRRLAQLRAR